MKLTVFHLKNCDTCKKALRELQAVGHDLVLVDVRDDGMPRARLEDLAATLGWEQMLNTRSTTWRNLAETEKSDVNAESAIALMKAHPTLIKRPVIVAGDKATCGWTAHQKSAWL